jgi:DNA-binding NtrC family response regulator
MNRILVLDPESQALRSIESLLSLLNDAEDYEAVSIPDLTNLPELATTASALLCAYARHGEALASRSIPVIVVDDTPDIRRAVTAIKAGASEYLNTDVPAAELLEQLNRVVAEQSDAVESAFPTVGASQLMQDLSESISRVAPTNSTVLISGESGTGKALVARAIHAASDRRGAPMIALNCATVPADLIESELFGQPGEAGQGLVTSATGGTLFLDEVGELPAAAQVRLLHLLEAELDLRLICATTRDLESLVQGGQFRGDLYYRLKVVGLKVPPLRERGDDVLLLADEILLSTMEKLGKRDLHFAAETQSDMRRYPWPGNVRELENAIQRAVILSAGDAISTAMLAIELPQSDEPDRAFGASPDQTIEDYFVSFVTAHQDNMTETELAEKLGISRKSLWERRQRLNIPRKKTKKRGRRRDVS